MTDLTRRFAEDLAARVAGGLDREAEAVAVALVRDGVAVAALGAREPGPGILAERAAETRGRPAASLIGPGGRARVAPAEAALVNGAAMHVLDFEPMWNPANHSLSTTLPALLALAEDEARSGAPPSGDGPIGRRLLAALAAGIEAQARLRLASGLFEPADNLFHPPGLVGPIGSAVACGLFLGLDASALTHAIGIAASRTGSLMANVGSMTKALHCGAAAAAGLESAVLAARGFTADADALGDPRGYGRAFFGDRFEPERLLGGDGPLHVVAPGPAYKLYPSQYGTHFVIAAVLDARAKLADPDSAAHSVSRLRVLCPSMPYVDRPSPATGLAGKFSFQYVAAAALLDGRVGVESFTDARRFAPDLERVLPLVALEPDPAREGRFDRMAVDVVIEGRDGSRVAGRCDGPIGIWGRPAGEARLAAKAVDCLDAAFGAGRGAATAAALSGIAEMDAGGLVALMETVSGGTVP